MERFFDDCEAGNLASYVFLEPAMYGLDQRTYNDQHPHAGAFYDLRRGEELYKKVYEALRASPQWNDTLFLLLWVQRTITMHINMQAMLTSCSPL